MKKILGRIIGILFLLTVGYQKLAYADIALPNPVDNILAPTAFLIEFIVVIILVISAISYFIVKASTKKQSMKEYDNEKISEIKKEKNKKRKNKITFVIFVCGILLFFIGLFLILAYIF